MDIPIIANFYGDVFAFESTERAQYEIEPIDIYRKNCTLYDGEGRLLKAELLGRRSWFSGDWTGIKIFSAEKNPEHANELKTILVDYLSDSALPSNSRDKLGLCSLHDLIQELVRRNGWGL